MAKKYTWYKANVKLGPGMTLAFRRGRGYYAKPGKPPLTLSQQALQQANTSEAPNLTSIQDAQSQYDTQEGKQETATQDFSQALAQLLGNAAPQTQTAYDNAAGATSGFAKGFSDAMSHMQDDENASLGSFLTKAGIPAGAQAQALGKIGLAPAADVVYGTGGYEPAAGFEREGAAATAAAAALPAYAAGLGTQSIAQLRGTKTTQDQNFQDQLAQERSKIPGLAQSILNDMLSRRQQQESIDIQKAYLGNSSRAADESATGIDPITGQAKPGYYTDKSGHVLPDGYVMKNGHPVRLSTRSKKTATPFGQTLGSSQSKIYDSAKDFVKTVKNSDPLAGYAGHKPAQIVQKAAYAQASKTLFNEYKYLLRGIPAKQQAQAKRLLTQTIAEALASVGIRPTKKKSSNSPVAYKPGVNP